MIPKIIHQVWIGEKKMPLRWMHTWRDKNPEFEFKIWREEDIQSLLSGSKNAEIYCLYYKNRIYHGAVDLARVEILKKYGGIYVDADSLALEPLKDAPFLTDDVTFFAAYDHEVDGHPGRITNGIIGAEANHPILIDYSDRIPGEKFRTQTWKTIGGKLLTECIKKHGEDESVKILPAWTFWAENWDGRKVKPLGKVYSQHIWGTTLVRYK